GRLGGVQSRGQMTVWSIGASSLAATRRGARFANIAGRKPARRATRAPLRVAAEHWAAAERPNRFIVPSGQFESIQLRARSRVPARGSRRATTPLRFAPFRWAKSAPGLRPAPVRCKYPLTRFAARAPDGTEATQFLSRRWLGSPPSAPRRDSSLPAPSE